MILEEEEQNENCTKKNCEKSGNLEIDKNQENLQVRSSLQLLPQHYHMI